MPRPDLGFCRLAVEVGGSSTIALTAHAKVASTALTWELEHPVTPRASQVLSAVPVIVDNSVVNLRM